MRARHAAESARRDEMWAERRAKERRENEARQRARELVDEAAQLLEQLGIRPDTVKVGSTGLVQMPAEVFDTLIRKAAEMAEMEGMGL